MTLAVLRLLGRASIALALGTLTPAACQPASAAEPAVTLHAGLIPEQLGKGTTIKFALTITPPAGQFPAALRTIDVRYPANLGLGTSNLGIDTCRAPILEAAGPPGCPADSVMGYGSGTVEVPFGSEILYEQVRVTAFMAPLRQGNIGLLLYADGESPVSAQLVFPATVLPATAPFGGDLTTMLPLISSVPEAPDVALLNLTMTLGPNHITYYEYARHKKIAYHPRGILLPRRCPRHGFQFAAELAFNDGTHASAQTSVPCPRSERRLPAARRLAGPRHTRAASQRLRLRRLDRSRLMIVQVEPEDG